MYKRTVDNTWNFNDANTKEFTHCYHTYPAMMIPQIARRLIAEYHPDGKCVVLFDPYMGSGTSLIEANIAGMHAYGTDINPLARLMSRVKTEHYNTEKIEQVFSDIQLKINFYNPALVQNRDFERISNYTFWYSEDSLLRLSYLSQIIAEYPDVADFFKIAISEVVREVSFTRNSEFKRYKMSDKQLEKFNPDVFRLFETKTIRNIKGLKEFNAKQNHYTSHIYDFNTVIGIPENILPQGSVDMVVTSPPYGDSHTTVAYGQFSRWSNEWFGVSFAAKIDRMLMGGEKRPTDMLQTEVIKSELEQIKTIDAKRYAEVADFLIDYQNSIANVAQTVREGGVVCYVVGNRTVKGVQIPLDFFTAEQFEKAGFHHINTIVRDIPNKRMPSKNSPTNVAGQLTATMTKEYIVILQK